MSQATLVLDSRVHTTPANGRAHLLRFVAGAATLSVLVGLLALLLPDSAVEAAIPDVMPAQASPAPKPAVAARTDPSVPDASEVFSKRETPMAEPAPTF